MSTYVNVGESCSQTELAKYQCCDSCYSIQSVLKNVGETLETCLRSISAEEPNLTSARDEVRQDILWCSQATAVKRWCDALRADSKNISQRVAATQKRNQELEFELRKSKTTLSTQVRDHEVSMEKFKRKSTSLSHDLSKEKKEKAEIAKQKNQAENRVRELEYEVVKRDEEIKKEAQERYRLQEAASGLEQLQRELILSQAASCENLNKIKDHLEDERKLKEALTTSLEALELEKKHQDEQLAKQARMLADKIEENNKLTINNAQLAHELSTLHNDTQLKTICEQQVQQIASQDAELKALKSQIELLTLYPDLNGPINPPKADDEDVLLTMENQFRANETRAQILNSQNERLSGTIKKLRVYMLKKV